MKIKILLSFVLSTVLLVGCEKNVIGDFEPSPDTGLESVEAVTKKGVAFTNKSKGWSYKTSDLGAHWMYSWNNILREEIPANVEYVPMFWGKGSVNDDNITRIKQLIADGKVKYVLGFNEPDGSEQANMTVDEAIALWPRLEELGVPLGSPATVNPNNDWMIEFMEKADATGLRVDFITVHHYGGPNVLSLINKLKVTYNAYAKRPIWITEFAVADWNATSVENNKYSQETVIEFMEEALEALNEIEWIQRYAWFDGRQAPLNSSALFDEDVTITSVGQVYAAINRNNEIGPGQDTEFIVPVDENELITNGGFESGEVTPWGGFKNGVGGAGINPLTGNFAGKIENGDGSLFQIVSVEPGKTYTLKFFSKWLETVEKSFIARIKNNADNKNLFGVETIPTTTEWAETTYEFTVPDGVNELKFVFFKGKSFPPFFMDDVSLIANE